MLGLGADERAAEAVGVAVEILRRRVHHDVGAQCDRALQRGREKRIVNADFGAMRVGDAWQTPAMSVSTMSGLLGVSMCTSLVFGFIAASTAARLLVSTYSISMP